MFKKLIVCAASALLAAVSPLRSEAASEIGIATRDWVRSLIENEINQAKSEINQTIGNLTNNIPPVTPGLNPRPISTNVTVVVDKESRTKTISGKIPFKDSADGTATLYVTISSPTNKAIRLLANGKEIESDVGYLYAGNGRYLNYQREGYIEEIVCSNATLEVVKTNEFGTVESKPVDFVFVKATSRNGETYLGSTAGELGTVFCSTNDQMKIDFFLTYTWDKYISPLSARKNPYFLKEAGEDAEGDDHGNWKTSYGGENFSQIKMTISSIKYDAKPPRKGTVTYYMNAESATYSINFSPKKGTHQCAGKDFGSSLSYCYCFGKYDPADSDYPEDIQESKSQTYATALDNDETWFTEGSDNWTSLDDSGNEVDANGFLYYYDDSKEEVITIGGYQYGIEFDKFIASDAYKAAKQQIFNDVSDRYDELRTAFYNWWKCSSGSTPMCDWDTKQCGDADHTWKICKRNSAHKDGSPNHKFGSHSEQHQCMCPEKVKPDNVGQWTKGTKTVNSDNTGWTRQDTCAVDGCNEKRTVSHTCNHNNCQNCDVTIPEDGDEECGDKCHTCDPSGHHFEDVGSGASSCAVCKCADCDFTPYDAFTEEGSTRSMSSLSPESLHGGFSDCEGDCGSTEEGNAYTPAVGKHHNCQCGLLNCLGDYSSYAKTHVREDEENPTIEEIDNDWDFDYLTHHYKFTKTDCSVCGARFAVKEEHDFECPDDVEPEKYDYVDNEKCSPVYKCYSGDDHSGCGFVQHTLDDAEDDEDHSPTKDDEGNDIVEYGYDDEISEKCLEFRTCENCGQSYYKEVDHVKKDEDDEEDPDPTGYEDVSEEVCKWKYDCAHCGKAFAIEEEHDHER